MIDYSLMVKSQVCTNLIRFMINDYDGYCNTEQPLYEDAHAYSIIRWELFLESNPGVVEAKYDKAAQITYLTFNDESALSMFLLRWR